MDLKSYFISTVAANSSMTNNWKNHFINPYLYYAHRETEYTKETYPAGLHFHDYYEVNIVEAGDISYVCDALTYTPQYGDVILIPPGKLHLTTLTQQQTKYQRYKLYLYENALDSIGCSTLLSFLQANNNEAHFFSLSHQKMKTLVSLFAQLDGALDSNTEKDLALSTGLIIQIFHLLDSSSSPSEFVHSVLPPRLLEVQKYLDDHFTDPLSLPDIAARFFYSQGHLSRLFQKYYHLTINEYLIKKRINYSKKLMYSSSSLAEICFQSGFGSLSTFIRAFHAETGLSPSQYRKNLSQR